VEIASVSAGFVVLRVVGGLTCCFWVVFDKATGVPQEPMDGISGPAVGETIPRRAALDWIAKAHTTRSWQWGGLPPGAGGS
jgi:hypothetical protein